MAIVIKKDTPHLFDRVIGEIQQGLADNIGWLDRIYGKAERLVKMYNERKVYTPNWYVGNNEYELLTPDSSLGNYAFFVLEEPQQTTFNVWGKTHIKTPFSLIVWVNMNTIETNDERDTEAVKEEILRTLNGAIRINIGKYTINRVYERAENVFNGFSLDEVDNQFLMQPYCGWRFFGEMSVSTVCI